MRVLTKATVLPSLAALLITACNSGDATNRVTGTVSSQLTAEGPEAAAVEVALLWFTQDGDVITSSTSVTGDYPASFSLDLSGPPPEGAIQAPQDDEFPAVAAGSIVALAEGSTSLDDGELLGFSEDIVLYLPEAVEAGSPAADELGPLAPGYHLLRIQEPSAAALEALDDCFEASNDQVLQCEDGCAAGLDPALSACEDDECFEAVLDENSACFDGCWQEDEHCSAEAEGLFSIEVLPIDTPITLVLFDEVPDFDDGFGDFDDDGFGLCVDEGLGQADECYLGCEDDLDVEACEALFETDATDEEINDCFDGAFDASSGCWERCDDEVEAVFDGCNEEFGAPGPGEGEEIDPETQACLDEAMPGVEECFVGCDTLIEESDDACWALVDAGAGEEEIDACFEQQDANFEHVDACFEGCDGLMMDAFAACGYDC